MRRPPLLSALLLSLPLACVGSYVQPQAPAPLATLRLLKQPNDVMITAGHSFYAFENEACRDTDQGGKLGHLSWATADVKTANLIPERRVYLQVYTTGSTGASTLICTNVVSFVPATGHTYEVKQQVDRDTCDVLLTDVATCAAPATFVIHPVQNSCRE